MRRTMTAPWRRDSTRFVVGEKGQLFQVDSDDVVKAQPGLNVYPRHDNNLDRHRVVPHFSEFIDALCYPMIFLYGKVWFVPGTIPKLEKKNTPKKKGEKKTAAGEFSLL